MNKCCLIFAAFIISFAAADDDVNPYQQDGDSSQECYAWAADGQCQLNPGHMLTACKYSCWEWYNFRAKSDKYAGAPIDRSMDCYGWANNGECGKNAVSAGTYAHLSPVRFLPHIQRLHVCDRRNSASPQSTFVHHTSLEDRSLLCRRT